MYKNIKSQFQALNTNYNHMKNTQNGFVGITIAVIVALVIGIGATYFVLHKNTIIGQGANYINHDIGKQNIDNTVQIQTNISTSNDLTDGEILNATYSIGANYGGVKSKSVSVNFPHSDERYNVLSGTVFISKNGLESSLTHVSGTEAFWISGYEYIDSSHTKAKVFVAGNFGASGFDHRVFIVSKIDGVITTKELACQQAEDQRLWCK